MCSLLLCHGADPTIPNCHSKTALDLATSDENRERIECEEETQTRGGGRGGAQERENKRRCRLYHLQYICCDTILPCHPPPALPISSPLPPSLTVEFRGYQLLSAAEKGDTVKTKKLLTCNPKLASFQHLQTQDSALVRSEGGRVRSEGGRVRREEGRVGRGKEGGYDGNKWVHSLVTCFFHSLCSIVLYFLSPQKGSPWWNYSSRREQTLTCRTSCK